VTSGDSAGLDPVRCKKVHLRILEKDAQSGGGFEQFPKQIGSKRREASSRCRRVTPPKKVLGKERSSCGARGGQHSTYNEDQ